VSTVPHIDDSDSVVAKGRDKETLSRGVGREMIDPPLDVLELDRADHPQGSGERTG